MEIIERLRCEIERSMQELDRSAKVIESDIEEMNHSLREINTLEDKIALKKKAFFSLECIERVLGSDGLLSRYISRTEISPDIWKKAGYDESIVTAIRTVSNNQFANYKNRIENLITKIDDDSLTVGKDVSSIELENAPSTNELPIKKEYREELIKLFHGHTHLLNDLIGKSDNEIVSLIRKWAKMKDERNKPFIENPKNNLKSKFAQELKYAGLINCAENTFRAKL